MDEPYLIFIARSKYPGRCKEKGCSNAWEVDSPCFWNPRTKESFCEECGEELNEQMEES